MTGTCRPFMSSLEIQEQGAVHEREWKAVVQMPDDVGQSPFSAAFNPPGTSYAPHTETKRMTGWAGCRTSAGLVPLGTHCKVG
ncbi:hypothetical protein AURDEDRAFT_114612 [Auricularia subglabra TFB-10046 SS5]|nr:hypothetical protein AURDEDRAFT_114612 [Auricularia subglabra TFB-10046 SS5]